MLLMTNTTTANTNASTYIPSFAEQCELATKALEMISPSIELEGRWFRVIRYGHEIRFLGRAKFAGEIPPSAHVACLRSDVIKAQTIPGEFTNDATLKSICERVVRAAVGRAS